MTINVAEKLVFECPSLDGGKTKPFIAGSHLGVDFGYWWNAYTSKIIAIQDGTVVDVGFDSGIGYYVVLQHNYSDGTHRWSGYIHLIKDAFVYASDGKTEVKLKVGDVVSRGTQIAIKGTTGSTSNGIHLHIYVSNTTTLAYTWARMRNLCNFDPYPYFYKNPAKTYCTDSPTYDNMDWITNHLITYPTPVERDKNKKQVNVLIDYLYMRSGAGTGNAAYSQYCTKGIYNIEEEKSDGTYLWYRIATINDKQFWIASGGTRTEDLLAEKSKEEQLQDQVNELNAKIDALDKALAEYKNQLTTANGTITSLNAVITKVKEAVK